MNFHGSPFVLVTFLKLSPGSPPPPLHIPLIHLAVNHNSPIKTAHTLRFWHAISCHPQPRHGQRLSALFIAIMDATCNSLTSNIHPLKLLIYPSSITVYRTSSNYRLFTSCHTLDSLVIPHGRRVPWPPAFGLKKTRHNVNLSIK